MLRDRQEKEQLVRKLEEILPFLKDVDKFGWIVPSCDADPIYKVVPNVDEPEKVPFKSFTVNLKTGWHSEVIYRDERGTHRIREGITPIKNDWSDYCYKSDCACKEKN